MGEKAVEQGWDTAAIMGGLYGDGIIGLKGAFDRAWVERMREDIEVLFEEARKVPGGALPRGPERYYGWSLGSTRPTPPTPSITISRSRGRMPRCCRRGFSTTSPTA